MYVCKCFIITVLLRLQKLIFLKTFEINEESLIRGWPEMTNVKSSVQSGFHDFHNQNISDNDHLYDCSMIVMTLVHVGDVKWYCSSYPYFDSEKHF